MKKLALPKSKKKILIIAIIAVIIIAIAVIAIRNVSHSDKKKVYVESVSTITGYGSLGVEDRFTGVVESQKAVPVKYDSSKTVKECFVKVGDQVAVGDKLFSYDTDAMNISIEEAQLEVDKLKAQIDSLSVQIKDLQNEKASASSDEQLNYTVEIQSLTNEQTGAQYDLNSKQTALDKLKQSLNNTTVCSETAGIVKTIGDDNSTPASSPVTDISDASEEPDTSDSEPSADNSSMNTYMTILPSGNYQIKGTLNELNKDTLAKDMPVIIRSRTDESKTYSGKITSVDFDNPVSSNNSQSMDGGENSSAGETASKYYFYVSFDNSSDLILGQHIYIEPDLGQGKAKDGMWLSEAYITTGKDKTAYVWKEEDGELVKQEIKLGKHDKDNMEYKILKGLTNKDYIAFPDKNLSEGDLTTRNIAKGSKEAAK